MLYNLLESKKNILTAGKISLVAACFGILVFTFVFLFNAGKTELMRVEADGTATTTLTVLNTPPAWVASTTEKFESSVTNPTNSGDKVFWVAVGNDPNGAAYYLLICDTNATPTARSGQSPICSSGVQWGVSPSTPSNTEATVSTTTTEVSPFAQSNAWYGWICDDDAVSPRCNASYSQGTNATNSSPFIVNYRPVFSSVTNDSPKDPSQLVTFTSSSTDPDSNNMTLIICSTAAYSTTTNTCDVATLATTTVPVNLNPTAGYTLPSIIRDDTYNGYAFIFDEFGHEASGGAQGTASAFTVNNVAPTVSLITINDGNDMTLTVPAGETTGFKLDFTTADANSCRTSLDALEITNFTASLYRSGVGSTSCDGTTGGQYDPNNCYTTAVATTTWNLTCTASSTSCALGGSDATMDWSCTFPLWYVTDSTDSSAKFSAQDWRASIRGIDDDNATGTLASSVSGVEVNSLTALDLLSAEIPYGQLEPGQNSGTLTASTSILAVGNTGLDQNLSGESMCPTFAVGNPCVSSASSTIPEANQQFATSTVAYGSGQALSSSTPTELELNVPKSTSTSTPNVGVTYWGIAVPGTITLAGAYTGLNSIQAITSESVEW